MSNLARLENTTWSFDVRMLDPSDLDDVISTEGPLRDFVISAFEDYYPKISIWFDTKVVPGFRSGERIIHSVYEAGNNKIVGVSIIKISSSKSYNKLCSFYVSPAFRESGIGNELMKVSLASLLAKGHSKPVLVTVPEERISERNSGASFLDFLTSKGFSLLAVVADRYRRGKSEVILMKQGASSQDVQS